MFKSHFTIAWRNITRHKMTSIINILGLAIGICALVLIGQSLQNGLPWIALAFGWGMYSAATVITSTVVSAYILDCFPKHSALASSIINFLRTTGLCSSFVFISCTPQANKPVFTKQEYLALDYARTLARNRPSSIRV